MVAWILPIMVALLCLLPIGSAQAPEVAPLPLPSNEHIPFGYKSYSMFLVCNPSWLVKGHEHNIRHLYDVFYAFGQALGSENLAIWFWKANTATHTIELLDTKRSATYCQNYRLTPSNGPYILVTRDNPEIYTNSAWANPSLIDHYVVSLNGLPTNRIINTIMTLTDQILVTGLNQSSLDATVWWQHLWAATETAVHTTACYFNKVKFSINASVVNAEIAHTSNAKC
jgi:hypothetical protein